MVVIGASAGGVEALQTLIAGLPGEIPAAIFIVLHVMPSGSSLLPRILARAGDLPVSAARHGEPIERGRVYVAPPDHHMLLMDTEVRLTSGPRENGHRPAVDALFRSAARSHGRRVIGVILSGALDDGTAGLRMVADAGGVGLVQDPDGAPYPSMPCSALEHTPGARAVGITELAGAICTALDEPRSEPEAVVATGAGRSPAAGTDRSDEDPRLGTLTSMSCPDCGGSLWAHDENGLARFKCPVGHAYSRHSLEVSQGEALEGALWAGLRSLQERADLFRRLARGARDGEQMEQKAQIVDRQAAVLRELVTTISAEPGTADDRVRPA